MIKAIQILRISYFTWSHFGPSHLREHRVTIVFDADQSSAFQFSFYDAQVVDWMSLNEPAFMFLLSAASRSGPLYSRTLQKSNFVSPNGYFRPKKGAFSLDDARRENVT
jgi:hypothetical protein